MSAKLIKYTLLYQTLISAVKKAFVESDSVVQQFINVS